MAINPKLLKLYQAGGAVNPYDIPGMGGQQVFGGGTEGYSGSEFDQGGGGSLQGPALGGGSGGTGGGSGGGGSQPHDANPDDYNNPNYLNQVANQFLSEGSLFLGDNFSMEDVTSFISDALYGNIEGVIPFSSSGPTPAWLNSVMDWMVTQGVLTSEQPPELGAEIDIPQYLQESETQDDIYYDIPEPDEQLPEGVHGPHLSYDAVPSVGYTGWGDLTAEMQDYIRGFLPDEIEEEAEGINWDDEEAIRELFQSAGDDALGEGLTLGGIRGISQDMLEEMDYGTYDVVREEGREDIISGLVGSVDQSKLGRTLNPELLLADLKDKFQSESFGLEEGISKKRASAEGDIANIMGEWSSLFV